MPFTICFEESIGACDTQHVGARTIIWRVRPHLHFDDDGPEGPGEDAVAGGRQPATMARPSGRQAGGRGLDRRRWVSAIRWRFDAVTTVIVRRRTAEEDSALVLVLSGDKDAWPGASIMSLSVVALVAWLNVVPAVLSKLHAIAGVYARRWKGFRAC